MRNGEEGDRRRGQTRDEERRGAAAASETSQQAVKDSLLLKTRFQQPVLIQEHECGTDFHSANVAYVDVPMGACVGTWSGQSARTTHTCLYLSIIHISEPTRP